MDYLLATDAKLTTETNSLWWKIDEHFDSGCEKEEDKIDDDFVLKFSTDESDCEDDDSHSDGTYYDRPAVSEDLAKNCSDSSSMQNNLLSTYALRYGDKITNTSRRVRRRNVKSKVINNQRSVLDNFRRHDILDDKVADTELKKDPKADVIVEAQKLMRQLLNARVILERLPDSFLVKNDEPSHDDCQEYQERTYSCKTKRYCASCDRTFIRSNKCWDCNSVLIYECSKCGTRYSSRQNLDYHQRIKCFSRPFYQCSQCNYSSPLKGALQKHIEAIHIQSDGGRRKSYLCRYCQETFFLFWEFLRHRQVCKQTDPKLADINSKKRKLSSCEFSDVTICKKTRFDIVSETLKVVKVFCDQKVDEFSCDICNKKFNTHYKLKFHRNRCKSGFRHIKCQQCEFRTKYLSNLKRHSNKKHSIEKYDESII